MPAGLSAGLCPGMPDDSRLGLPILRYMPQRQLSQPASTPTAWTGMAVALGKCRACDQTCVPAMQPRFFCAKLSVTATPSCPILDMRGRRTSPRPYPSAGHLGTAPGRAGATSAVTEPSGLARRSYGQASQPPFHAVPVRALRPIRDVVYRSARNGR